MRTTFYNLCAGLYTTAITIAKKPPPKKKKRRRIFIAMFFFLFQYDINAITEAISTIYSDSIQTDGNSIGRTTNSFDKGCMGWFHCGENKCLCIFVDYRRTKRIVCFKVFVFISFFEQTHHSTYIETISTQSDGEAIDSDSNSKSTEKH